MSLCEQKTNMGVMKSHINCDFHFLKIRAKPEGTTKGKGLYLTVYPKLSPNMDII